MSPPPSSSKVGWIVDRGSDFPAELHEVIESWQTSVVWRQRDGLTTRGWNGYSAHEHRDFKYLTPKMRLSEDDLTTELLASRSYHMVCSQQRCISLVKGTLARRNTVLPDVPQPLFIWEPVPDFAVPEELDSTMEALNYVDVISPNHSELAHIFGRKDEVNQNGFNAIVVEECAARLLAAATKADKHLIVVVRAGKEGCFVATNSKNPVHVWIPAYHGQTQGRVIDPTGGGNGFLGGFAVGMVRTGDPIEAAIYGSISASYCVEQVGVPVLGQSAPGLDVWNDVDVQQRLIEFKSRIAERES